MRFLRLNDLPPDPRRRLAAGRVWAAHEAPYLASALLALDPVVPRHWPEDAPVDLRPFPADRSWHLYIDPGSARGCRGAASSASGCCIRSAICCASTPHDTPVRPTPSGEDVGPLGSRTVEQQPLERRQRRRDQRRLVPLRTSSSPKAGSILRNSRCPEGLTAEQYWDALDQKWTATQAQTRRWRSEEERQGGLRPMPAAAAATGKTVVGSAVSRG